MKVLFSPQGGISKELTRLIKVAKGTIDLAAYAFTAKYLGNALAAARKKGVKIRIIMDRDNADNAYSIDEWLVSQGMEIRFIQVKNGCMHHKFLIIDGKTIMMGSYNLTNESEFRNYEAALFTTSKSLIKTFAAEFERLWQIASPRSLPASRCHSEGPHRVPILGGGGYGGGGR